ncbi:hypothetical protein V1525DRAFT_390860 [Lipomyces kononenkoae]|uniref:Uncharacterized protein n=1 Tax=Lipomyces kononenkoae TaxID=34357 RepID=A0ACC3STU5_LIPKO
MSNGRVPDVELQGAGRLAAIALASIPELLAWIRVDRGHIRRVQGELEATGFRETKVGLVNTYMPFEIARFLSTLFLGMSRMTSDMGREEVERVRDLIVRYIKSKHP